MCWSEEQFVYLCMHYEFSLSSVRYMIMLITVTAFHFRMCFFGGSF